MPDSAAAAAPRRFHGLFIGINRYQFTAVRRLASAARDAKALYALFSDNLGAANTTLLVDRDATHDAVVAALDALQTRSTPDDVVVISFSGHGSTTHELVTHDADPDNLRATSLPLDQFTDLVSAIPARQLVVILDCCFAGGAGAKVLHPRGPARRHGRRARVHGGQAGTDGRDRTADPGRGDRRAGSMGRSPPRSRSAHLPPASGTAGRPAGDRLIGLYDLLAFVAREVKANASGTVAGRQKLPDWPGPPRSA